MCRALLEDGMSCRLPDAGIVVGAIYLACCICNKPGPCMDAMPMGIGQCRAAWSLEAR